MAQQAGCGVLVCALLLSICLPLMGMRSAEPENPILQAAPQEITVLQAGQAPGHAGNGEAESTGASGSGGSADSELTGEQEQPDPQETENQAEQGQDTQPEQQSRVEAPAGGPWLTPPSARTRIPTRATRAKKPETPAKQTKTCRKQSLTSARC